MGAAHLLNEMMVIRFDGGAHQPQSETTMLNTTNKRIAEPGRGVGECVESLPYGHHFLSLQSAVDDGGVEALFERTRRKPNLSNRVMTR